MPEVGGSVWPTTGNMKRFCPNALNRVSAKIGTVPTARPCRQPLSAQGLCRIEAEMDKVREADHAHGRGSVKHEVQINHARRTAGLSTDQDQSLLGVERMSAHNPRTRCSGYSPRYRTAIRSSFSSVAF